MMAMTTSSSIKVKPQWDALENSLTENLRASLAFTRDKGDFMQTKRVHELAETAPFH